MGTDWPAIANQLTESCPSPAFRSSAARILAKVELLGPLLTPERSPADEFRRVYTFLTYNEPAYVMAVVEDILSAFGRNEKRPLINRNAWNYVVGVFDVWINRARVFYMAAGLIEGALRARLDARLTDLHGADWPSVPDLVPTPVLPLATKDPSSSRISAIRRILDEWEPGKEEQASKILTSIHEVVKTAAPSTKLSGAELVAELEFGQLRSFFQARRLWRSPVSLSTLFFDQKTGEPPLRSAVDKAIGAVHDVRNAVAHYRRLPNGALAAAGAEAPSFSKGLFALAKVAQWMGVDLQHFYAAVDTRGSTELSRLIEDPVLLERIASASTSCAGNLCAISQPLDVLLERAPISGEDVRAIDGTKACLVHRVSLRVQRHRPTEMIESRASQ